jgi:hypothetical protein
MRELMIDGMAVWILQLSLGNSVLVVVMFYFYEPK